MGLLFQVESIVNVGVMFRNLDYGLVIFRGRRECDNGG